MKGRFPTSRRLVLVLALAVAMLSFGMTPSTPGNETPTKSAVGWAEGVAFPSVSLDFDVWYTSKIKIKGTSTLPGKKVSITYMVRCYDEFGLALPVFEGEKTRVPDTSGKWHTAILLPSNAYHCTAWVNVVDKKARNVLHVLKMIAQYVADKTVPPIA